MYRFIRFYDGYTLDTVRSLTMTEFEVGLEMMATLIKEEMKRSGNTAEGDSDRPKRYMKGGVTDDV